MCVYKNIPVLVARVWVHSGGRSALWSVGLTETFRDFPPEMSLLIVLTCSRRVTFYSSSLSQSPPEAIGSENQRQTNRARFKGSLQKLSVFLVW